jgi:HEPN domain-containing protein
VPVPIDLTARKYIRAADQRLFAADFLLKNGFNFDAVYLAGYVIECALKSLVLERTPRTRREELIRVHFRGTRGHSHAALASLVRQRQCIIPPEIAKAVSRAAGWSTDLRYEVGAMQFKDASAIVDSAQQVLQWVNRSL